MFKPKEFYIQLSFERYKGKLVLRFKVRQYTFRMMGKEIFTNVR